MHSGYVSVIAVYAPTNEDRKEEETERFYAELQEILVMCLNGTVDNGRFQCKG